MSWFEKRSFMKAIRLHNQEGANGLVWEDAPLPNPQEGEVLVRVEAVGVSPAELGWSTTWKTGNGTERHLPIPGHEVSGLIQAVGAGVNELKRGEAVYGLTDFTRDGAEAEYTLALPSELAHRPRSLDAVQAAAAPMGALTAWQALFEHAGLSAGQTVLIHGAAGGVGSWAVQLARWVGARVIGTASARHADFLRGLGVEEIIDYTAVRYEDVVHDVDVVLDLVGGDTPERSWGLLKKGGILVSAARRPDPEQAATHGVRGVFFIVRPNREQLTRVGALIDAGLVKPAVSAVLPLPQAREAYANGLQGHNQGKVVLKVESWIS